MARKATETKTRILKMTRSLFSQHGYDGTSLDDILTACGITKGAFYYYFKSKDALFLAVIEQSVSEYKQLAEGINTNIQPVDQLRQWLERLADLNASGHWTNCRMMVRLTQEVETSQSVIKKRIRQFWQWYLGFIEEIITTAQEAGQISVNLPAHVKAQKVIRLWTGAIALDAVDPFRVEWDLLPEQMIQAIQG